MSNFELRNNIIITPGNFMGQPRWAPHFWAQGKQGLADVRIRCGFIFDITKKDVDKYPELSHYDIVTLIADRQGFVSAEADYEDDL